MKNFKAQHAALLCLFGLGLIFFATAFVYQKKSDIEKPELVGTPSVTNVDKQEAALNK